MATFYVTWVESNLMGDYLDASSLEDAMSQAQGFAENTTGGFVEPVGVADIAVQDLQGRIRTLGHE